MKNKKVFVNEYIKNDGTKVNSHVRGVKHESPGLFEDMSSKAVDMAKKKEEQEIHDKVAEESQMLPGETYEQYEARMMGDLDDEMENIARTIEEEKTHIEAKAEKIRKEKDFKNRLIKRVKEKEAKEKGKKTTENLKKVF